MKIMDILVKDAVILDLASDEQARGPRRDGGCAGQGRAAARRGPPARGAAASARRSRAPGSARASRSPTGRCAGLDRLVATFARSRAGVDFDSIDGQPTHLFFLLVVPEHSGGQHLKALARISRFFRDAAFREKLLGEAESRRGRLPGHRGGGREVLGRGPIGARPARSAWASDDRRFTARWSRFWASAS